MREAGCRPKGRLCCWALVLWMVCALALSAASAQSGPATTTISDTVYSAGGTPASGVLIITWPAFSTASGAEVAAGSTDVTLGAGGSLSVALVPNAGATPAGVYYTVVYQLGPGEVKTESWVVPISTTPVNLAAVIATPSAGVAGQAVSMQYVNTELAAKANDNAVVHLSGTETITGTKAFASAPSVPTPVNPGDVASKGYVDQSVSNVGAGNYLPTAGGTMTGPITLPGNPTAPLQSATKSYVDSSLSSKADLVSGLVPASELGTGQATSGNCLTGNGTWAPCAAGGTGNLSTTPAASQTIAQPVGTQFSTNNLANIRYVTASWNWLQTPTDNLATPGSETIHLAPCPLGLDTTSSTNHYIYKVYLAGTGTPEAVPVTGGSCAPGTSGGTIIVTTAYPHAAGYTVGSASGGIQEAWNDAWTSDLGTTASNDAAPYVKLMSDTNYFVYASVYLRGRGGMLDGAGALIVCSTRDRCVYIGTTQATPYVNYHKLYNLSGTSVVNVDGVQVASVAATSGIYTITTASNHPFVVGDVVDCEYYSQNSSQHWASTVTTVPSSTSFTVAFGSTSFAAGANTFGFCGLLNAFIEDNSDHVSIQDIHIMQVPGLAMGQFSYGIVDDNDQQFIIERATNRSSGIVRSDANFPMGAFVYERTDQGNAGITYLHNSEFTNVNCAQAGSNGFVMSDTVCQGFPVYGVRYFGIYQPATFTNVYQESTSSSQNALYGYAAEMGYLVQGGQGAKFVGTFPTNGYEPEFATGGSGTNERTYYVVPRSSTMGYGPVLFAGYAQPSSATTNITVTWPSIQLQDSYYHASVGTLTWDILVNVGQSAVPPYQTGMYALATNAAVSCGTNGMCSYPDTQATPVSYTVAAQQFTPAFWFWPANLAINNSTVFLDVAGGDPQTVASQGTTGISIVAEQCQPGGSPWRRSPIWVSCLAGPGNYGAGSFATVLQEQDAGNNGPFVNSKGRLNFGKQIGTPNDLITLADSNFFKTVATAGQRPSNDAGDVAIGVDQSGGLSQRAASSISSYINVVPSGTNFLERLTASGHTVNVPLTVNGNLTVSSGTVSLPVTGTGPQCLHVSSAGVVSGTGVDCGSGSGGGGSDPVTVNVGTSSQLALYGTNGSAVNGDSTLTDNGTTLNYSGTGGIAASSGTFSGNLTVNGQLEVAGPWAVSSPIPGTVMSPSGPGTSSLGISDDGNFYISANGGTPEEVATTATSSYFTNLWQEDANDVGVYNSGTPNSSSWQRTTLGFDTTDNLAVVKSENSTPSSAPGLGFWVGSSIRWAINSASELKPFTNNSFNIGDSNYAPQSVFAATSFDTLTQGRQNFELCNDTTTGTMLNFLAVYNGATLACAVKAGTSSTDGVIGIVSNGSGTSGNAVITYRGYTQCSFDGGTTAGDYVVASTTNPGDCHDVTGGSRPSAVQVLGRMESTNAGPGTYGIRVSLESPVGGGGSLNSPTFTGTVTLPDGSTDSSSGIALNSALVLPGGSMAATQATTDNSTKVATTAYVQNQNYQVNTPRAIDASLLSGSALDAKLNNANALAITSGESAIDARALGGAQTLAHQVTLARLLAPTVSASGSGSSLGAGLYRVVYSLNSPTYSSGTATSSETIVTLAAGQSIQINAPAYYGTATSWSYYISAAGGAINSETLCGNSASFAGSVTVSSLSGCSGGVSTSNPAVNVTLYTPSTCTWTVTYSSGSTSPVTSGPDEGYGLMLANGAVVRGLGVGEGQQCRLHSNSASQTLTALWGTDPYPVSASASGTGGSYAYAEGFGSVNDGGANLTAAWWEQLTFDSSYFANLDNGNPSSTYPANANKFTGTCCGTTNVNVHGENLSSGGDVCSIGQSGQTMTDTIFVGLTCVHPGKTHHNVNYVGTGYGNKFIGTYLEGNEGSGCDTTTPFIDVGTGGLGTLYNVEFDGVDLGAGCSGSTAPLIQIESGGYPANFKAKQLYSGFTENLVNDLANSATKTCTSTPCELPEYGYSNQVPYTFNGVQIGTGGSLTIPSSGTVTLPDGSTNTSSGYSFAHALTLPNGSTATTQSAGNNSTNVATTAYVDGGRTAPLATSFWSTGTSSVSFNATAAKAQLWGFTIGWPITSTKVTVGIVTADTGGCTYDIGVLNGSGNIVWHTGNQTASALGFTSTGTKTISWAASGSAIPGKYYIAITANATSGCATLGASVVPTFVANTAETVSSGGTLNNAVTIPADSQAFANVPTLYIQ
jgi:hypothetical protein